MKRLYGYLLSLFLLAPDGAGGGGTPGGVPPEDWIKRLNGADKKDRKAIVEELAKTLGVKTGDAYKALKEAGWDPVKNEGTPPAPPKAPAETFTVTLRHTSPYPHYRRAGLLLTGQWKPHTVTAEQLAVLKTDEWVVFQNPAGPDNT